MVGREGGTLNDQRDGLEVNYELQVLCSDQLMKIKRWMDEGERDSRPARPSS